MFPNTVFWGTLRERETRISIYRSILLFIGTTLKKKGIDTFYQADKNKYHLTSSILKGHSVRYTIEAVLKTLTRSNQLVRD